MNLTNTITLLYTHITVCISNSSLVTAPRKIGTLLRVCSDCSSVALRSLKAFKVQRSYNCQNRIQDNYCHVRFIVLPRQRSLEIVIDIEKINKFVV